MNYIVMDMEWNQPFSANAAKHMNGVRLVGEIMQIGAVKIDKDRNIIEEFEVKIKPKIYTTLSRMVKAITGLTEQELERGVSFRKAVELFRYWCGEDYVLFTWGVNDLPMLKDNLRFFAMRDSWIPRWYNAQCLFNKQTGNCGRQFSIDYAMEYFAIEPDFARHDALGDARYTAQILSRLDIAAGIEQYDTSVISGAKVIDEANLPKGSTLRKGFESKVAAAASSDICIAHCPECGARLIVSRYVQHGSSRLVALVSCKKCGSYAVKVKFKQTQDKKYCYIRTVHPIDEKTKKDLAIKLRKWGVARQYLADRANKSSPAGRG